MALVMDFLEQNGSTSHGLWAGRPSSRWCTAFLWWILWEVWHLNFWEREQSGVLATLRISVATLTFLQIRLALCSSYAWFSKSLYTWLSCAEQAIYLPGEFIGLVMKKYETIVSLSAKEGKDGSPLIALWPRSVVKTPRHFAQRVGPTPD